MEGKEWGLTHLHLKVGCVTRSRQKPGTGVLAAGATHSAQRCLLIGNRQELKVLLHQTAGAGTVPSAGTNTHFPKPSSTLPSTTAPMRSPQSFNHSDANAATAYPSGLGISISIQNLSRFCLSSVAQDKVPWGIGGLGIPEIYRKRKLTGGAFSFPVSLLSADFGHLIPRAGRHGSGSTLSTGAFLLAFQRPTSTPVVKPQPNALPFTHRTTALINWAIPTNASQLRGSTTCFQRSSLLPMLSKVPYFDTSSFGLQPTDICYSLSKSPDPGYFTCLSSCPCTAGFSTNCCQDLPFCALEPTRNGRPQLPPVPAILAVATTMDNADPGASILGITGTAIKPARAGFLRTGQSIQQTAYSMQPLDERGCSLDYALSTPSFQMGSRIGIGQESAAKRLFPRHGHQILPPSVCIVSFGLGPVLEPRCLSRCLVIEADRATNVKRILIAFFPVAPQSSIDVAGPADKESRGSFQLVYTFVPYRLVATTSSVLTCVSSAPNNGASFLQRMIRKIPRVRNIRGEDVLNILPTANGPSRLPISSHSRLRFTTCPRESDNLTDSRLGAEHGSPGLVNRLAASLASPLYSHPPPPDKLLFPVKQRPCLCNGGILRCSLSSLLMYTNASLSINGLLVDSASPSFTRDSLLVNLEQLQEVQVRGGSIKLGDFPPTCTEHRSLVLIVAARVDWTNHCKRVIE
ncbi:uncharacterized protein CLUP02_11431 [Colletotrichum lupini]|uniref:Uncharacterized protein n=1 Tax=Colletotrichum lupini TaxID=145971 RepID=A0A9Q8SYN4_9PEZI|nr:uncharacterized protein CLUP02_11431 [Colletotrichum lupini]UQC85932.1 hypothetical protein CLUP02_11431 [Colletotrichum lupini]